ncbi:HAD superfamily hydrolase (TIGR01509 family) [Roseiarcus fermentans]|uniref:HAD superfamily hydrolase (TIGR01509 family) n=1 Tax=Roseiarcus fermentans TaxID=1473586 RepID=A0A366F592_9HYPH|nr:HAD family phosphatase [Roseiarcus fermentans]RBP09818.1 HAD superfamily hydrolase (TIGR01509 family) [Roseiarcus fermentans]
MPVKAVLWDLDGTFVDSEPTHNRALLDALAAWSIRPSEALQRKVVGTSMEATHAVLAEAYAGFPDLGRFVDAKLKAYVARVGELRLRRGVADAEGLLEARGVSRAIVSNSDRIIVDANLAAVGKSIPGLITISRNDVRKGKPDPGPYLRAAYLLHLSPPDCVVVEDSPVGAAAGVAAGMKVVAWPEHGSDPLAFPPEAQIADPVDLRATLAALIDATGAV